MHLPALDSSHACCRAAGVGHEFFADCVAAVEAAARAPHAEHLSVSALHLLQAVARRLAASGPEARADVPAAAWLGLGLGLVLGNTIWFRLCAAAVCHAASQQSLPSTRDRQGNGAHARCYVLAVPHA